MSHGASFPSRLVRLIEPFGTGGGPDIVARRVAEELSEMWGWAVAVENHPGAGSTAAPTLVAQAAGDGHTLLVNTSAHAYSAAFASQLPYDPLRDFVPVAALTTQPYVLIAGAWSQITTLGELVEAAKASPGAVRFASTGLGTGSHLAVEKLTRDAGINTVHMPAGPSESIKEVVAGVVAGRATFVLSPISIALSHIRTGDVVALGVSTPRRSRSLPDVPTLAEARDTRL
jgi:tripartite-type tricarboxylate transporter receptor subunit TctC